MKIIFRILIVFYLCAVYKYSAASTIISSQDGNWEDSTTWNTNQNLPDSISGDTIVIAHHINFNHALIFSNCYIEIDTLGTLCGHDSISLYSSIVYMYGGAYAQMLLLFSSKWLCYYGYWIFISDSFWYEGVNWEFLTCCGGAGHTGGGFICSNPVQSWRDTTQADTVIIPPPKPPILISVYPNPSLDHFIIDSEVPDSNSQVTLHIYDLLGRKMKTITISDGKSSLTIFTNNWAAGMYLLNFEQGETIIQTDKIVRVQ